MAKPIKGAKYFWADLKNNEVKRDTLYEVLEVNGDNVNLRWTSYGETHDYKGYSIELFHNYMHLDHMPEMENE